MSLDIMTLALAKSYTDQHGGGGGENTIYIPAKLNQSDDGTLTIETSVTFEQVEAAYRSGQEQILRVIFDEDYEDTRLLSLVAPIPGNVYYFGTILGENSVFAGVLSSDEWVFEMSDLTKTSASKVSYSDTTVKGALDVLVPKSHTHDNKSVLDKLSVAGGKLQYDGSDVGLKPVKGTDYWTEADKEEIVNDVLAALPTWTGGSY